MGVPMKRLLAVFLLTIAVFGYGDEPRRNPHNFLWVIDNSPSFQETRREIIRTFGEFAKILKDHGGEFQMAVTTTDMFTHAGALVSAGGVNSISSGASSPEKDFETIVL